MGWNLCNIALFDYTIKHRISIWRNWMKRFLFIFRNATELVLLLSLKEDEWRNMYIQFNLKKVRMKMLLQTFALPEQPDNATNWNIEPVSEVNNFFRYSNRFPRIGSHYCNQYHWIEYVEQNKFHYVPLGILLIKLVPFPTNVRYLWLVGWTIIQIGIVFFWKIRATAAIHILWSQLTIMSTKRISQGEMMKKSDKIIDLG